MMSSKDEMGLQKDRISNKACLFPIRGLLKNRKFNYTVSSILVLMFVFIFTFQNYRKEDGSQNMASNQNIVSNSTNTISTTTTTNSLGDKAVFRLSKKYGGENISNVSWQTYRKLCRSKSEIAFKTGSSIQIPWNNQEGVIGPIIAGSSLNMRVLIPLEQCLIYRHFHLSRAIFSVGFAVRGPVNREPWSVAAASLFSFDNFIARANATTCMPSSGTIAFSLSDNTSVKRNYFPVGSSVNLEFGLSEGNDISLEGKSFQWSIKKVGDNDTELADQSHTSKSLTHTFSQMGLYTVFVKSSDTTKRLGSKKELLIGLCEKEVEAVEVVIGGESFGDLTPERILQKEIIFNYVRPADTDSNNKVTFVFNSNSEDYQNQRIIYKYKRNSPSKFIDIDIQNADACFLNAEPLSTTTCYYMGSCPPGAKNCKCSTQQVPCPPDTENGICFGQECSSPDSCAPGAENCSCFTSYKMRENLSPLSSCSGRALDMSMLDTDTTKCTDAIFVVAASKTGQKNEVKDYRYYKHCPADQEYCYFGEEHNRPSDHQCSSS